LDGSSEKKLQFKGQIPDLKTKPDAEVGHPKLKLFCTSLDKLLDCFSTKHLSKPGDFTDFHDPFGT
jgi:hypothetical protein